MYLLYTLKELRQSDVNFIKGLGVALAYRHRYRSRAEATRNTRKSAGMDMCVDPVPQPANRQLQLYYARNRKDDFSPGGLHGGC